MKTIRKALAFVLAGFVLVSESSVMAAERVALVIGNDAYETLTERECVGSSAQYCHVHEVSSPVD